MLSMLVTWIFGYQVFQQLPWLLDCRALPSPSTRSSHPCVGQPRFSNWLLRGRERDKVMVISVQIWTLLMGQSSSWALSWGWSWMMAQFLPLSNCVSFSSFQLMGILEVLFNTYLMSYTPMQRCPPWKPDCGKDIFIFHLMPGLFSKFGGPGIKWKHRTPYFKSI